MILFGTNVGYYAFSEMAHAPTFLFASLFLATWWRVRESEELRDWLVLGLVGGFLSICRWQDVLYMGGPLLFDLFGGEAWKRRRWWQSRVFYAAGIGVWWIPQVLQWKAIYGKYITIPQEENIFVSAVPHVAGTFVEPGRLVHLDTGYDPRRDWFPFLGRPRRLAFISPGSLFSPCRQR